MAANARSSPASRGQLQRELDDAQRRVEELSRLHRVLARVTTALRPDELCETLVDELHTTLGYPLVALMMLTEDEAALRVVSRRGYVGDVPALVPVGEGIVGRAARTGTAVLVENVAADAAYLLADPRVCQEACVPILVDGRVYGVINIEATQPVLGAADIELLTALAGGVSVALRNSVLFGELQSARDELQALHEAAHALGASLELSAVLESLVSVTCRRFGYDRSAILLPDDHGDLRVRAASGSGQAAGTLIPRWDGVEGRAAQDRQPVMVTAVDGGALPATLAIPLVRDDRVIGVFSVGTRDPERLGGRARNTLTTLAEYALVAIENARLYEQTRHQAATDSLTGLANHRAFIQGLDQELERCRRYTLPLALVMIEIDRFKRYNDAYGHLRGDEVLRLVARTMEREHRRQIDVVARYGGDEFMVLLPHTPRTAAADVAERIRRTVESTPLLVGREVTSVTVSLGVAGFPEDGDTTVTLIDAADRNMYRVKQAGGNAVAVAVP